MSDRVNVGQAYNCPSCAAPLAFDPTSGKLKCDFCNSAFTPEEIEEQYRSKEAGKEAERTDEEWKAYSCSSCGAELLADQNTAVIRCPYCGNNTIATARFAGNIRPDYVIPFKMTKEQAMEEYSAYYKKGIKKFLLPKSFHSDSHVEEIQGVYIPFWLFNGRADIDGIYRTSNSHRDGDYEIVEHYRAKRAGRMDFKHVPADASARMPDDLMDSIEPYDYQAMKPFAMSYLPGFLAERFDVDEEEDRKRAKKRIEQTIGHKTEETLKYDRIDKREKVDIDVHFDKTNYALLPAWLLTTQWNDRQWTFAMNGQTKKFTGNLPINGGKFALLLILSFLVGFVPLMFFSSAATAVIVGAILAGIVGLSTHAKMKPVSNAQNANAYMGEKVNLSLKTDTFLNKETNHKPQKRD